MMPFVISFCQGLSLDQVLTYHTILTLSLAYVDVKISEGVQPTLLIIYVKSVERVKNGLKMLMLHLAATL